MLWRGQPIPPVYPVAYMDGMRVDKVGSDRTLLLVDGMRPDRVLEVLGFCVSSGEQCTALLEDLRRRSLEQVRLLVSDDSRAIRSALEQVYPLSAWQYCTFHRLRGPRKTTGPADYRDRMAAEAALKAAGSWRQRWQPFDP